jgi:hypothetical protein
MALATALVAVASTRASAEQPSQQTLAAMGLGGLSAMSDDDALAVRGFGYRGHSKSSARAYGHSWANISSHGASAGSKNGYDSKGKHSASGKNLSYAGKLIISGHIGNGNGGGGNGGGGGGAMAANGGHGGGHGGGIKVKAVVVFAGGSSTARAH